MVELNLCTVLFYYVIFLYALLRYGYIHYDLRYLIKIYYAFYNLSTHRVNPNPNTPDHEQAFVAESDSDQSNLL